MLSRLFVIILAVPLLIYILLVGNVSFLIMTMVIIGVSMYEFYSILKNKGQIVYVKTGIFLGIIYPIFIYFNDIINYILKYFNIFNNIKVDFDTGVFIVFSTILIAVLQIKKSKIKNSTSELTLTLFGIIYISFFMSYIILMRENLENGRVILLFTMFSIWSVDTFAYIFGILLGGKIFKRKLSEKISPKKSIEGFIGGILGVFLVAKYFEYILNFNVIILKYFNIVRADIYINRVISNNNLFKLLILSILIAIFSVLGDLFESKLKREFGVKDSGNILLGHGGFLDRFDSVLFVLPVVYYYIKLFII